VRIEFERIKTPLTGALGVGTGAAVGELTSETAVRVGKLTGNKRLGVKAILKGVVGGVMWFLGRRTVGLTSLFLETASYGSWGSILLDVIARLYPGGVTGAAQAIALRLQGISVAGRKVAQKLEELEKVEGEKEIVEGVEIVE